LKPLRLLALALIAAGLMAGGAAPALAQYRQPSFSFAIAGVTPAATPTDWFTLCGSASKSVSPLHVEISGIATAAGTIDVVLVKRTAADTGGTKSAQAPAAHDGNDVSAQAVLSQYTANPASLGTGIAVRAKKLALPVAGAAGTVEFDFTRNSDKPVIESGAAQCLAINLNGSALPAGTSLDFAITWGED
jgi:hypothetical protein